MAFLHEDNFMPPQPSLIPFVPAPEWSNTNALPSPRRGKDSFGMVRFVGMTPRSPRRPQKLKAIDQELAPKECFSARDVRKGTSFDMDILSAQPESMSARQVSTMKVRAIDLDLGLSASESSHIVSSPKATKKNKDKKDIVAKLRTQVHSKEQHLDDVRAEMETTARETTKVNASYEKLQTEHAILQARHTWAKSSLDSALSTQDEYKRHYESVEASFAKAKSELARQEELLKSARDEDVSSAIQQVKADFDLRETQLEAKLIMVEQSKQLTILKLKENSRAILECMAATQQTSMTHMAFQQWIHAVRQERVEAENAKEAEATQHLLRRVKDRKMQLAFNAAERLASVALSSLASITLRVWAQQAQEAFSSAPMSPFRALLRGCDASPRPAIPSMISRWQHEDIWRPEDDALQQCQAKHRGKAASVLQRLVDEGEAALVSQAFSFWSNEACEAKAERGREVESQAKLAGLEATLQALRETLQRKTEELEDANEDLEEAHQKNREVIDACKEIMALQTSLGDAFDEIEAIVYQE